MSLERFLVIDSLPKIYQKPVWQKEKQKCCVFCSGENSYYHDIVKEWYDVSEDTKFPWGLKPELCPHDEWLTRNSIRLANLLSSAIENNDHEFLDRGAGFADVNPQSPKEVLELLSDADVMEFIILEETEFSRTPLDKEVADMATAANVLISFERFQEINDVAQRKLEQLSCGELSQKKFFKEIREYVKVFDPSVDESKFSRVIDILNIFQKRNDEDQLCQQAIEMLRELGSFISALDWKKYDAQEITNKYFRMHPSWKINWSSAKGEWEEFYLWLEKIESRLGRKAQVIDVAKSEADLLDV